MKYKNRTVRSGVFETNSSSAHSVVVGKVGSYQALNVEDGILSLEYEGYGWSGPACLDPYDKACYAATWARNYGTNEQFDMFIEVMKEQTGAVVVEICEGNEYYSAGYIDHQSIDVIEDFFQDKNQLKELIFNNKYSIIIDNDNH